MPLEGSISVNVQFRDTTTSTGVQSLKTITLQEGTEYTTGKVALLNGTAGTASVAFGQIGTTTFKDSSGNAVVFSTISRVAFSWSGSTQRTLQENADTAFLLKSKNSFVSLSHCENPDFLVQPVMSAGTGTGTYTIVLYGT